MQSKELIEKLERLAPPEYAESWDNPGLLVGSAKREVHKVYIALDADGRLLTGLSDAAVI